MPRPVIFINSHPIQYFVPLYQYLNREGLPTECWYCSDETVKGHYDRQFGAHVAWDIPLLEGYSNRFFRNRSWKPSLYSGFFGLVNPGLLRALWRKEKSIVIVHGWNYFTHVMAIIVGKIAGHSVCIRGESPLSQEVLRSGLNKLIKRIFLQYFLFLFADRLLFIGKQNRKFYEFYGVPSRKLLYTPYAVDNERFSRAAASLDKTSVRRQLGVPIDAFVILFTAKFIHKKRPMDLLKSYHDLDIPNKFLIMAGEGEERGEMESFISANQVKGVLLPGFVNQGDIVKFYKAADVFVLCSGAGETWGLSVNEAMNFNLPVVVSRITGCSEDLVTEQSGYIFETGSVEELTSAIRKSFIVGKTLNPAEVVSKYSYAEILRALSTIAGAA